MIIQWIYIENQKKLPLTNYAYFQFWTTESRFAHIWHEINWIFLDFLRVSQIAIRLIILYFPFRILFMNQKLWKGKDSKVNKNKSDTSKKDIWKKVEEKFVPWLDLLVSYYNNSDPTGNPFISCNLSTDFLIFFIY